ncbi:MAG: peptidoglycan-associated lipoprotein Pal [Sulfuricellaceae bacterium]|nr:peptidoglycan-associated lipoprotein Pal [Sulfuricellaceae bacterium]
MNKLILSAALLALLSACASTSDKDADATGAADANAAANTNTGGKTTGMDQTKVSKNPLTDPANILSKRSIYFDLDSYSVKDEYRPLVESHAQYLKQNASAKAFLQGNTDERGSREYNLALGQKRAESVKKMMSVMGVSDNQMETVSFGEEKPKSEGHDDSAWSQNRRADIVYQGE